MPELTLYSLSGSVEVRVNQGSYLTEGDSPDDSHASGLDASAIDLALSAGTPVYSFFSGKVVGAFAGYGASADTMPPPTTGPATFGNYVTVKYVVDGATFYVTFAHLSQASAQFWLTRLSASADRSVDISQLEEVGRVAGASETPYPVHLHLSFAATFGNYAYPNGIAIASPSAANTALLSSLTLDGRKLSELHEGDFVTASPIDGDDFRVGGPGPDTLNGLGGNDTLMGNGGDDYLNGGSGHDSVAGGDGFDQLFGEIGNDTLRGGAGVDALRGGAGNDLLDGGDDYDFVQYFGASAGVFVRMGVSGPQNTGGAGIDTLVDVEALSGSAFGDTLVGSEAGDQFYGEGGNDSLFGGAGSDLFRGGTGNDTIDGGSGNDLISYQYEPAAVRVDIAIEAVQDTGGSGFDRLIGLEQLVGSEFNDTLSGTAGPNLLNGLLGNDSVSGRAGNDTLFLSNGNDTGSGGDGDDRAEGGSGNDLLDGGIGNDVLTGESGSDTVSAGAGNDSLNGGADADSLSGSDGNDILDGGGGNDVLAGGRGADLFIFGPAFGRDTVIDFRPGEDDIRFSGTSLASFSDLMSHASQVGAHVVIALAGGGTLQLNNVGLGSLSPGDFLFV